jgi:hypothetical protein
MVWVISNLLGGAMIGGAFRFLLAAFVGFLVLIFLNPVLIAVLDTTVGLTGLVLFSLLAAGAVVSGKD